MKKIVIVGYMASGKSIIGERLSNLLNVRYVDLDVEIEKCTKCTIQTLIETKGELYFRKIENDLFKTFLLSDEKIILSLGGGTPCYYNNHLLLQHEGIASFFLDVPIPKLVERIQNDSNQRPLIKDKNTQLLTEFVGKHLFERRFYYSFAKNQIKINNENPQQIAERIYNLLT